MPSHAPIRLVFIDVDGTLVGAGGTVHPGVWPAAERLRARGVHLALCTGRPGFGRARDWAARLDPDGWHVFQNGASVVHLGTGASRSAGLPPSIVPALVRQAAQRRLTLELYGDAGYVVQPGALDLGDRARRHADLLGIQIARGPLARFRALVAGPPVRAQWLLAHGDETGILAEPVPGARLVPSLSPMMPDTRFLSVLASDMDKVVAVRDVASAYGVSLAETMFVGDGANDAAAMAAVGAAGGVPVAVANAEAEAIAAARLVVGHVDAGGLVDAFLLALGDGGGGSFADPR